MNCEQFEAALNAWLDERGRLDESSGGLSPLRDFDPHPFERHRTECADCQGLYAAYASLTDVWRFRPPPMPRDHLAETIVAAGMREHAQGEVTLHGAASSRSVRNAGGLAWRITGVAASVLLLAAVAWAVFYFGDRATEPAGVAPPRGVANSKPAPGATGTHAPRSRDGEHGPSDTTASGLDDALALIRSLDLASASAYLPEYSVPVEPRKLAAHVSGISSGISEPLAQSATSTAKSWLSWIPRGAKKSDL